MRRNTAAAFGEDDNMTGEEIITDFYNDVVAQDENNFQQGPPRVPWDGITLDMYKKVLASMRRRLFQEILTEEERRRLALLEEDIEGQINTAGNGELMHLLRQVEPLTLRKQLLNCFRVYSRRVPSTLEVVCSFCRRKVKKDQVARVEIPRRDQSSGPLTNFVA